jgi:hypothetical protein
MLVLAKEALEQQPSPQPNVLEHVELMHHRMTVNTCSKPRHRQGCTIGEPR